MGVLVWALTGHNTLGEILTGIGATLAVLRLGILVFAAAVVSATVKTARRRGF